MHHQRHRRAGRQHLARRSRDGAAHAAGLLRPDDRHQHAAPLPDEPQAVAHHRHAGAAEQGDRRAERLRPRGRHPPGRHAQGAQHLRDHEAGGRGHPADGTGARQAQRPARAEAARHRPRLPPDRRATEPRCSRSSSSWPTRRRRSTTRTSRRWPRTSSRPATGNTVDARRLHQHGRHRLADLRRGDAEAPGRHGPPRRGRRQRPDRRAVQGDQPRSPASQVKVVDYRVRSVTQDMDALGEAQRRDRVRRQALAAPGGERGRGRGQRAGVPGSGQPRGVAAGPRPAQADRPRPAGGRPRCVAVGAQDVVIVGVVLLLHHLLTTFLEQSFIT